MTRILIIITISLLIWISYVQIKEIKNSFSEYDTELLSPDGRLLTPPLSKQVGTTDLNKCSSCKHNIK